MDRCAVCGSEESAGGTFVERRLTETGDGRPLSSPVSMCFCARHVPRFLGDIGTQLWRRAVVNQVHKDYPTG
jgi:hypothetical protein